MSESLNGEALRKVLLVKDEGGLAGRSFHFGEIRVPDLFVGVDQPQKPEQAFPVPGWGTDPREYPGLGAGTFHWRYHPVASRMIALSKLIVPLEHIAAHFAVYIASGNVRFRLELAGGSLMDLGCSCVHMVRTLAGEEPRVVSAKAVQGPPGVDVSMGAELSFPSGLAGFVSSR